MQIESQVERRKPSVAMFVLVWLLLFFGSALTIMNFHADVNMLEVQIRIVEMLTGHRDEHPIYFRLLILWASGLGWSFFSTIYLKRSGTRSLLRWKWKCICIRRTSTNMSSMRNTAR